MPLPTLGAAGDPGLWLHRSASASASVVDWPGSLQVSLLHVSLTRTSHWMIQDALVLRSLMSFLCKNLFPNKVPFTGSRVSMWTHLWGPRPMDPLLWEDCREPWSPAWPLTQLCAALTRQSSVLGALQGGWACSVLVLPSQVPSAQHSRFWGTAGPGLAVGGAAGRSCREEGRRLWPGPSPGRSCQLCFHAAPNVSIHVTVFWRISGGDTFCGADH